MWTRSGSILSVVRACTFLFGMKIHVCSVDIHPTSIRQARFDPQPDHFHGRPAVRSTSSRQPCGLPPADILNSINNLFQIHVKIHGLRRSRVVDENIVVWLQRIPATSFGVIEP